LRIGKCGTERRGNFAITREEPKMSQHADLLARHQKVLPSWIDLLYETPIAIVDGSGRHVVDAEGNRYLDFFGGILTTSIGYNIPEIVDVVAQQVGRMVHTSTLYLIEQQIELAERIAELSGLVEPKVFFVNSGSEANDTALMLATNKRRSNQVLTLRNSYHGRSFGTTAVTGIRSWTGSSFSPLNVSYVQSGYRFRSAHPDDESLSAASVRDLREIIGSTTSGDIACLIVEPIQGLGGFIVPPRGMLAAMKEVTDSLGILFISDEVQTGWGRTGDTYWGIGSDNIRPHAMTFAKGLANGLPIAGVVAEAELMESAASASISTFGGNPLATSAALATLDYIEKHNLQQNAKVVGDRLLESTAALCAENPIIGDVRGRGLMVALEFVEPGTTEPDVAATKAVLEAARRRGLLLGKGGLFGNVIRMAPPMSVTADEAEQAMGILAEAISTTTSGRPPRNR
jgi:4-aminobutyrate aminotransferase